MTTNWTLKRKDNNAIVTFPQDLIWTDEFAWSAIAQSTPARTLSGALIIQQGTKLAGRPITLGGEWVWHRRADLLTLQSWTAVPELQMTLTHYDQRTFNVIFRSHETAIDASPVLYLTPEDPGEPYQATLNLMTV